MSTSIKGTITKVLPDVESKFGSGKPVVIETEGGEKLRFTWWDAPSNPSAGDLLVASNVKETTVRGEPAFSASGGNVSLNPERLADSATTEPLPFDDRVRAKGKEPVRREDLLREIKAWIKDLDGQLNDDHAIALVLQPVVEGLISGSVKMETEEDLF